MKSVVSRAAQSDLQEIVDFIAEDNPRAADRWLTAIASKFKSISKQPMIYPARQELGINLRFCTFGAYNIYFQVKSNEILFVRVLHGARDVSVVIGRDFNNNPL